MTDGRYTVKVYKSEKGMADDGTVRTTRVMLKPDSTDPSFEPLVLAEGEPEIVAEFLEVLG